MSSDTPQQRLEALGDMTEQLDNDNPSSERQQAQQQEQEQVSAAEQGARDWGLVMFTIGGFACMLAPELKPLYAEDRCLAWGASANAVAEKYGWNSPGALPELALVASTLAFAVPTAMVLRDKVRQAKEGGPTNAVAKVVMWWRMRKARKGMQAAAAAAAKGEGDGVEK